MYSRLWSIATENASDSVSSSKVVQPFAVNIYFLPAVRGWAGDFPKSGPVLVIRRVNHVVSLDSSSTAVLCSFGELGWLWIRTQIVVGEIYKKIRFWY